MNPLLPADRAYLHIEIEVKAGKQCLFNHLLDSIEGLASRSVNANPDKLDVYFDLKLENDFELFLEAWNSFSHSDNNHID
ncbi:MAG TPA: hypothetical protein PK802_00085 [Candidatus Cloacimonadota bacterium]|nr:hypothetical protein [Candidatus Cloacimonadota bacterium]HOF59514.1 hypothetical protein [Candidatus Cloacimonadota bacterium]HOR58773.1 hypothetical protein [Candidatus Cloacimonadota bacterium]HPB08074.1 hypothetical protein [Candidatus Cloacimonadota bacterium]HQL13473.1 hypothetical protein [Candidatus Cloacimonadota bacterium]